MKKVLFLLLAVFLFASFFALSVSATPPEPSYIYVTIVDENGEIVLAHEKITIAAQTVDDALWKAHVEHFEGGADAGYAAENTSYGISLTKLWGYEGGSYGYYVNDRSAASLADPVQVGDHVFAFVYTDTEMWSDTYCFFQKTHVQAEKGDIATLTLTMSGYDENWNPVTLPVEGAVITVNGEKTDLVTDKNGQVAITYEKAGKLLISAEHDKMNLVPPVLIAEVEGGTNPTWIVLAVAIIAVLTVTTVLIAKKKRC